MAPGSKEAGASTTIDVSFMPKTDLPTNGVIKLICPAGFTLESNPTAELYVKGSQVAANGGISCAGSDRVLTCTRDGAGKVFQAGKDGVLLRVTQETAMKNPSSPAGTATGDFQIHTYDSTEGAQLDDGTAPGYALDPSTVRC